MFRHLELPSRNVVRRVKIVKEQSTIFSSKNCVVKLERKTKKCCCSNSAESALSHACFCSAMNIYSITFMRRLCFWSPTTPDNFIQRSEDPAVRVSSCSMNIATLEHEIIIGIKNSRDIGVACNSLNFGYNVSRNFFHQPSGPQNGKFVFLKLYL